MIDSRSLAQPARPARLPALAALVARRAWDRVRRELRLRRDIQHLRRLDDSHLADLGLTPGAIEGAVRGTYDPRR